MLKVYFDFMYFDKVSVVHVIDDATHFSAAQFVDPPTA